MKHWKSHQLLTVALGILMLGLLSSIANAAEVNVPRLPKELLKEELDNPDIVILDVRTKTQWKNSEWKIKGSTWEDPMEFESWANFTYSRKKTLVLSCAGVDEATSARLAQRLLQKGYTKVFALKGGWDGWVKADYPLEKRDPLPEELEAEQAENTDSQAEEETSSEDASENETDSGDPKSSETSEN